MIVGLKCDGCGLWSRLRTKDVRLMLDDMRKPYYCDECEANVTWSETKANIKL